jgi:transporter family-2 protein
MSTSPERHRPTVAVTIAVAVAVAMGMLVAIQSRINGALGAELGDGFLAALISFVAGLLVLSVAMLVWRPGRAGLGAALRAVRDSRIPWWYLVGGAGGAFLVLTQTLTVALLGVALFTVATVSGQTISGLLIDRRGLGTMTPKPLTAFRIAGSILALLAVVLAVSAQLRSDVPFWALLLPFLAGIAIGWQQAVNGQVRSIASSALTATFVNFLVGTTVLTVATLVHSGIVGWNVTFPTEWWLYLGGFIGVIFIAGAAIIVKITGVLVLSLATVAGQLVMSVLLDVVFPVPGHVIVASTIAGTALTLVAVAITAIPSRRRSAAAKATGNSGSPSD